MKQLLSARPDLRVEDIRGNVPTRLEKLAESENMTATVLAAAGLARLNFKIDNGQLIGDAVPDGLMAVKLDTDLMLPCAGQAAVGIEVRSEDERIASICARLNHFNTRQAVTAERTLLSEIGGGCSAPLGTIATINGEKMKLRAVSFLDDVERRAEATGDIREPEQLGVEVAGQLRV